MCKAKLSTLWMLALDVVIDSKGFIQQHSAGLQRVDKRGEERSVQVKEDENGIVRFMSEMRLLRRWQLQIQHSRTDVSEMSCLGVSQKPCEGLFVSINSVDLVAQ